MVCFSCVVFCFKVPFVYVRMCVKAIWGYSVVFNILERCCQTPFQFLSNPDLPLCGLVSCICTTGTTLQCFFVSVSLTVRLESNTFCYSLVSYWGGNKLFQHGLLSLKLSKPCAVQCDSSLQVWYILPHASILMPEKPIQNQITREIFR